MKSAIKWFCNNPVAGNFLLIIVFLLGVVSWVRMKKEIFPETSVDVVNVSVVYPNATPEEIERGICIPIEESIADLEGIERIVSASAESLGTVSVQALSGYPIRDLMDNVQTRVSALNTLPQNAEKPIIEEIIIQSQVLSIAVSADTDEDSLRKIAEKIKDDLLIYTAPPSDKTWDKILDFIHPTPRITRVSISGLREREISIEIPEKTLRQYGLSLEKVASAIRQSTVEIPGGSLRTNGGEIKLRATGRKYHPNEFRDIIIAHHNDGSALKLHEIATIHDGFEDTQLSTKFSGKPALLVNVFCVSNEDTIAISKAVKSYLKEAPKNFSESIQLEIWNDMSTLLSERMDLLERNGLQGFFLVCLILALFLRPIIATYVAIGIPIAFCGAALTMPFFGISINMISLFGFILVLGIVVDDAVVVGENVYTRIQKGESPKIAAWKGAQSVSTVVIFGVLTTVVAFVPMLTISGVSGKIYPHIALVVILCLAYSLLEGLFILPSHLATVKPLGPKHERGPITHAQQFISKGLEWFINHLYTPILKIALKARYVTIALFIVILLITVALVAGGWVKTVAFPSAEGDILNIKFELARGAPYESTKAIAKGITQKVNEIQGKYKDNQGNPAIKHVLTASGHLPFSMDHRSLGTGEHLGQVTIEMCSSSERPFLSDELIKELRSYTDKIPGIVSLTYQAALGPGSGKDIEFNLIGRDMNDLKKAVAYTKEKLSQFIGVTEIEDSDRIGKQEIQFNELTPAGHALGLKLSHVAQQVRASYYGDEVQRFHRNRDELKIKVRYPESERKNLSSFDDIKIMTPTGDYVPLLNVTTPVFGFSPDTINRVDRMRSIKISADVDTSTGANADQIMKSLEQDVLPELPLLFNGVKHDYDGELKDQKRAMKELSIGLIIALLVNFVLMGIPLKSYTQPLIVMSAVPFCAVGAILAHLVLNLPLSVISFCGIVALAGMVVNNSLIIVDYVNYALKDGLSLHDAAIASGSARFRPIFLTTATTFFGLIPIVLETSVQAQFIVPMAVSLAGGILFATVITLFLVPALYLVLDDIHTLTSFKKKTLTLDRK